MAEADLHRYLVMTIFGLAVVAFVALLWVTAPYGRHLRRGWGPTVPARVGWVVMESPAVLLFLAVYSVGDNALTTAPLVLLAIWQLHYVYRTFVFPFRLRGSGKQMPVAIVTLALVFNCLNAYVNARWISHLGSYDVNWLYGFPFVAGVLCFVVGWRINQQSDSILIALRRPGDGGYRIPHGGLFRWVSCPNYLGEMLEWIGWAIATWSLAGTAFAVFTVANLLPRALANHRWYRQQFDDYPASRRALIPRLL